MTSYEWHRRQTLSTSNPDSSLYDLGPLYPTHWPGSVSGVKPTESVLPAIFQETNQTTTAWMFPHAETVNGATAHGWNEGLMEYWQYAFNHNTLSFSAISIIWKLDSTRPPGNYYNLRIANTQVSLQKRRNGTTGSVVLYPNDWTDTLNQRWVKVRCQFRWLDPLEQTQFQIKAWILLPEENVWREYTPEGGIIVDDDPIPDSPVNMFMVGGGDNRTIGRFRLRFLSNPPL
jgi:hypothetical protein